MARTETGVQVIAPQTRQAVGVDAFTQNFADPTAGADMAALAQALGLASTNLAQTEAQAKAKKEAEYTSNLDYYAQSFIGDHTNGLVDSTQVGKAYPGASPIVVGKITGLIGQNWGNTYARTKLDQFLGAGDANRLDPVAQKAFFEGLRQDVSKQTQGNPFYGQGALSATNQIISEYESNLQRETATYHQGMQEEDFVRGLSGSLLSQPVALREGGPLDPETTPVALMELVASGESNGNYNAYSGNAGNRSIDFTNMSIKDVMAWQVETIRTGATPSSAVGKYQVILDTMRGVVKEMGIAPDELYTPELQDRIFMHLAKRRGYDEFVAGTMSADTFQNNLAMEWASLPTTGGGGYYAGQHASVSSSDLRIAMSSQGPVGNAAEAIDAKAGATTSINGIRRRELVVSTAIQLATATRDTSILKSIPAQMLAIPEVALKVAQAQEAITNMSFDDWNHQRTVQAFEETQAKEAGQVKILQTLQEGGQIDIGDYMNDPDLYAFAKSVQGDERTRPEVSASNVARLQQQLLGYGTTGVPASITGVNDFEKMRFVILGTPGILAADRQKMLADIPTLLDGVNLLNDQATNAHYDNYVGNGLNSYLMSAEGSVSKLMGDNTVGQVRAVFDSTLSSLIEESIADGYGVPRGKAKREMLKEASDAAAQMLEQLKAPVGTTPSISNPPAATDTPPALLPEQVAALRAKVTDGTASDEELIQFYMLP